MFGNLRKKIFGPAFFLIGLFCLYQGYEKGVNDSLLKKGGLTTKAIIQEHMTQRGRRGSTTYFVLASFGPESSPTTQKFHVSEKFSSAHPDGSEIEIRYLPANPSVVQIVGQENNGVFEKIFGGLFAVIGLVVSYLILIRPWLSSR